MIKVRALNEFWAHSDRPALLWLGNLGAFLGAIPARCRRHWQRAAMAAIIPLFRRAQIVFELITLPRKTRLFAHGFLTFFLLMEAPAFADSGQILPRAAQTFRGWGMSLAWEANDIYGGGRQVARIADPQLRAKYMDLLYGDPAKRLTLGLNLARYNIGGGDDPAHASMRADAQMEGFQAGPATPFDWSKDAPQRRMLQAAKDRGANIFEAFSNSPPYWMTLSGSSAGGTVPHQDNLQPGMRERFVQYLAAVVKHFRNVEGVNFESLEPFNEPDRSWTATPDGSQEGYSASYSSQSAVIASLADQLKRDHLDTFVSGVDMNNVGDAIEGASKLSSRALSALGRLNTHDYRGADNREQLQQYKSLAERLGRPIWMSELGCCFTHQGDGTPMWGALFMADSIRMELRDLGAEAWAFWQPDWNVIAFDAGGGPPRPEKQFYALAQYSRFIRPGFKIISAGDADNTLAAYSFALKRLVLVSTNWEKPTPNDLDLSAFGGLPSSIVVYRTTADEAGNLQEESLSLSTRGHIVETLPPRSITTYVVDGVSPL